MADLLGTFALILGTCVTTLFIFWIMFRLSSGKPGSSHGPDLALVLRWHAGGSVQRSSALLLVGFAALVGFGLGAVVMEPRGSDAYAVQACNRTVATLLATRDAVELERSRYLVGELGCSIRASLPGLGAAQLGAAQEAVASLPGSDAAQPTFSVANYLLNALMVTVIFVGGTFGFVGLFNLVTGPS